MAHIGQEIRLHLRCLLHLRLMRLEFIEHIRSTLCQNPYLIMTVLMIPELIGDL